MNIWYLKDKSDEIKTKSHTFFVKKKKKKKKEKHQKNN